MHATETSAGKGDVPGRSDSNVRREPASRRVVASVLGRLSKVSAADTRPDETIAALAPGWPDKATSLASAPRAVCPPAATLGSSPRTSCTNGLPRPSRRTEFNEPPPRAVTASGPKAEPPAPRKPAIRACKLRWDATAASKFAAARWSSSAKLDAMCNAPPQPATVPGASSSRWTSIACGTPASES